MNRRWILALAVASCCGGNVMASDPSAVLVVLDTTGASASFLDPDTLTKITQVRLGPGPVEIALSPDGLTAYVALYGGGDPSPTPGHQVAAIDMKTRKLTRLIDVKPHQTPWGIAIEPGGLLWVTCEQEGSLLVLDPKRKEPIVDRVPLGVKGSHRILLSPDGTKLYATSRELSVISVVDVVSRQLLREIRLSAPVDGITLSADGKKLYACPPDRRAIFMVDAENGRVTRELPLDEPPGECRLTPDGRTLLMTHREAGTVEAMDTETFRRRGVVRVGKLPAAIATSADGKLAYVTNAGSGSITQFEVESLRILRTVAVAKRPGGIVFVGK